MKKSIWHVYILKCQDNSFYTGITSNLNRRLKEHLFGRGCRYTRVFGAKKIVYQEKSPNRSAALKREFQIKSWPRDKKIALIKGKALKKRALPRK